MAGNTTGPVVVVERMGQTGIPPVAIAYAVIAALLLVAALLG